MENTEENIYIDIVTKRVNGSKHIGVGAAPTKSTSHT